MAGRVVRPAARGGGWLLRLGAVLGALSIWLIAVIVCYDVILRYLGRPTLWALEVATYLMLGSAILASGKAVVDQGHFAVRLLPDALPPRWRRPLDRAVLLLCAALMGFVTYGFWELAALSWRYGMTSPTLLQVPLVVPQAVLLLGGGLMLLGFLLRLLGGERPA